MSDTPPNPMQAMTKQATEAAETGMAAVQDMGRKAAEAGRAGMAEFTRMFSGAPKFPGMPDMEGLLSAHRRNIEVLSAANRVALEGAQTVAKRHMEIMQQTMAEMTDAMRGMSSGEGPADRAAKQTDMLKLAYERAVAHLKELADLIQRSNGEAMGMLNQRFTEAMDEVKLLQKKATS